MSDERNDDEILGRALSRAIETQDVHETPYERSRLAVRPLRRALPVWQTLGVAAALLLAVAFGAWFTRPNETPVVASTATPAASATPAVTGGPQVAVPQYEPVWVYFTRDSLPPVGATVNAHVGPPVTTADQRVGERLMALAFDTKPSDFPTGTIDPLADVAGTTRSASGSGGLGIAVHVDGDLATLDFQLTNGWGVRGASMAQQLVQQIVYTTTEEPGVRRVLIREQGKTAATIDQLAISKPLTRDDVSGYATLAPLATTRFGLQDRPGTAVGAQLVSRDIQDGTLVRLTFEGRDRAHADTDAKADLPTTTVTFARNDGTVPHNVGDAPQPAYVLTVGFQWNSTGSSGGVGHVERVDRSPLRLIAGDFNTFYQLGLDDARPWRAYMPDAQHLVVEIGGDPRLVSDRISVTGENIVPGATISRSFTISGSARTFEANVVWRVLDASKKVIATGHTTATLGSSEMWGTFSTQVTLPANVSGNITLEVYEVSMKDGSELGVVSIPLTVR